MRSPKDLLDAPPSHGEPIEKTRKDAPFRPERRKERRKGPRFFKERKRSPQGGNVRGLLRGALKAACVLAIRLGRGLLWTVISQMRSKD
jgi:hypothetical protein